MFQHPEYFLGLFLLLPLGLLLWTDFVRGRRDMLALLGKWRAGGYLDIFTVKWFFSSLALVFFIVFIVLAAADPERKGQPEIQTVDSRDIVFAVDVSLSMLAEDSSPNRLERSIEVMRGILAARGGTARFALVAFQGAGVKMIPITEDLAMFETVFQNIGPDMITIQGSDLPAGIESAIDAFPGGVESDKLLFLFTDGENFGGQVSSIPALAREKGVRIISIGAGTAEGTTIPGEGNAPRLGPDGAPIVTRLYADNLRYLAQETEGDYFSLNDPTLMRKLDALFGGSSVRYNEPRESAYRIYLLIAVSALMIYFFIRIFRWKDTF